MWLYCTCTLGFSQTTVHIPMAIWGCLFGGWSVHQVWYFYWTQKSWGGGVDGWLRGQNTTNKEIFVLCLCLCVRMCDHIFYISFLIFTLLVRDHIAQNLNLGHCEKVTVTWQQLILLLSFGELTDVIVLLCVQKLKGCAPLNAATPQTNTYWIY